MKHAQPTSEVRPLLSVQDIEAAKCDHHQLAGHEEEREITRLEMWIDALAGIVVTLTVLSLMEALNEPTGERVYLPFLVLTLAIGFILMATILTNTYLTFQWLGERAAHDPVALALGLLFIACLSLFTFGLQSLMQSFLDQSAIYFFGGIFVAINVSSLVLFLYCIRMSELGCMVANGRSAVYHELAYYIGYIAILVGVMIASTFVPSEDQTYIFLATIIALAVLYFLTRTDKALNVLLPEGFPRERIDLFTDGVYAVAVTLFLIEIKYPASHDHYESLAVAFLREEWRAVVGQFVSFAVLGLHWYLQNYLSAMTRKPTSVMFSIALGHCMMVALFPFTVKFALMSEFSTVWRVATPAICYSLLALTQLLLWFRARGTITDKVAMYICRGVLAAAWLVYLIRDLV